MVLRSQINRTTPTTVEPCFEGGSGLRLEHGLRCAQMSRGGSLLFQGSGELLSEGLRRLFCVGLLRRDSFVELVLRQPSVSIKIKSSNDGYYS
jgi:hypothetical protein